MRQGFQEDNFEMNTDGDQVDGDDDVSGSARSDSIYENPDNLEADIELNPGEFSALNTAMDQLQAALDTLESRNAGIHEELLQLLQANREMRRGINSYEEEDNSDGEVLQDSAEEGDKKSNGAPPTTDDVDGSLLSELAEVNVSTVSDINVIA